MKKLNPILFLTFLVSCSPKLAYVGNTYTPSQQVDVYLDENAIGKKFQVIGVVTPSVVFIGAIPGKNYDGVIARKAVELARKKGADAVFFQNYYRKPEGGGTKRESTTVYSDTAVTSQTTISRTISPLSTGRQILLLKYVD